MTSYSKWLPGRYSEVLRRLSVRNNVDVTHPHLISTQPVNYNSPYTAMVWLKLIADTGDYTHHVSLSYDSSYYGWEDSDFIGCDDDGVTLRLGLGNGGGEDVDTGTALVIGKWYHVALVRSSATSLVSYLDGVLDVGPLVTDIGTRNAVVEMYIGGFNDFEADAVYFNLKIWQRALSVSEIVAEMRSFRPKRLTDLYAWYWLDGIADLRDRSGLGDELTITGTVTSQEGVPPISLKTERQFWPVPVIATGATKKVLPIPNIIRRKSVKARTFNTSDASHLQVASLLSEPAIVSVTLWAYIDSSQDTEGGSLFSMGDSVGIVHQASGNILQFYYYYLSDWHGAEGSDWRGAGWIHIALVCNPSANLLNGYVNGSLDASDSFSDAISYTLGTDTVIGGHADGGTTYDLTGRIADVGVYGAVLSTDRISSLAQGISPIKIDRQNLLAYWPLRENDLDVIGGYHFTAINSPTRAPGPLLYVPDGTAKLVVPRTRAQSRRVIALP